MLNLVYLTSDLDVPNQPSPNKLVLAFPEIEKIKHIYYFRPIDLRSSMSVSGISFYTFNYFGQSCLGGVIILTL